LLLLLAVGLVTCRELIWLLRQNHPVPDVLCYAGVVALLAANWIGPITIYLGWNPWQLPRVEAPDSHAASAVGSFHLLALATWGWVALAATAFFLAVFLVEMANFKRPSGALVRMALVVWAALYLGLLPGFLAQLRWLPSEGHQSTMALILTIFVPKCCDIGAYFTGRWFGRTRMSPVLSPKKTWEGAVGGLALATLVVIGLDYLGPAMAALNPNWSSPASLLRRELWAEIGFGVTVGGAGILGDLGESLIKRESQQKDASQAVPGFGGVLDVIDAVLFAGPVAYLWLVFLSPPVQN
jgi:phosphatidate cytidylyltransferase